MYKSVGKERSDLLKREANYINKSLTFLEQVIIALHEKSKDPRVHVPYRNSLMTSILRDSLGGNCQTVMIANLSSDLRDEEETISTARFAQRCQLVQNLVCKNRVVQPEVNVSRLISEN